MISAARVRAAEFGAPAISPATGAALRVLAAALAAKTIVEVGTGVGLSALYLLEGMSREGVLTTIDPEAEHQRQAKITFQQAGIPSGRTRTILGRPNDVLPRLAEGTYDMVVLHESPAWLAQHGDQTIRLLHAHGTLVIPNALWHDSVADTARRDEPVVHMRSVLSALRDDERVHISLSSVGTGLLVAARTGH